MDTRNRRWFGIRTLPALLAPLLAASCPPAAQGPTGGAGATPTVAAAETLGELQEGRFEEAYDAAGQVLAAAPSDALARVVRAVAAYRGALGRLHVEVLTQVERLEETERIDHDAWRGIFERLEQTLGKIEDDLAVAAEDPGLSFELCLACWRVDWDRSGEIGENDRLLFQIELGSDGEPLPPGDPRRKPTFRFDTGDVWWARAMVAFQRAVLQLGLGYSWTDLDGLLLGFSRGMPTEFRLRVRDADRLRRARELVLAGLDHAERARKEYLAETDDDREWVPNPRQLDHPLPLPVDDALYETWERVVRAVRRLLRSEDGLDVAEIAQLGDHQWDDPPRGFIDLGRFLGEPSDVVLKLAHLEAFFDEPTRAAGEQLLRDLFGAAYVPEMAASALPRELLRMRDEVVGGSESLERKLRYLFWIN
ncbi:MAG: hypothetical protein JXB32_21365 [Deltaproteobacteria bacterium]|nr:hypothetical protein [Deltaproteobacteria bacterium]